MSEHNGQHFAVKENFQLEWRYMFFIMFIRKDPHDYKRALLQIMTWRGDNFYLN